MNFNDLWFRIEGESYRRGLYHFDETMSRSKACRLYRALLDSRKKFKWMETHFVDFIISVSAREHRRRNLWPLGDDWVPVCSDECKWRRPAEQLPPQKNALRIEALSLGDRCGWNLKKGRLGGENEDYYYCSYEKKSRLPRLSAEYLNSYEIKFGKDAVDKLKYELGM